jgi:hypothetical protein
VGHLSNWHSFNGHDRTIYPKVNSPMQVKYADGILTVGDTLDFFPSLMVPKSPIIGWGYIKTYSAR